VTRTLEVAGANADDLLRTAQEAAYRLPPGFGGFAAAICCSEGGQWAEGTVRAWGPGDVEVDLDGDEGVGQWARRELASMVGHRWTSPYEEGDGRYAKRLDGPPDALGGQVVVLDGDPFSSSYRVAGGGVAEVNRTMGSQRFTIVVHARTAAADGRLLPAEFSVHHWDGSGRLVRSDGYSDEYVEVEGVPLPARRRVVSAGDLGLERRELRLSDHALVAEGRS